MGFNEPVCTQMGSRWSLVKGRGLLTPDLYKHA